MTRLFFATAVLLLGTTIAQADTLAITNARILTAGPQGEIASGTIVVTNGKISAVGASVQVPSGATVIDAGGKTVTPGLYAAGSNLGAVEIDQVDETNDNSSSSHSVSAAFDISYGIDSDSMVIPVARQGGITRAVVTPVPGEGEDRELLFAGQAAIITLADGAQPVVKPRAAMVLTLGEAGTGIAGGSRGSAITALRADLDDVRWFARNRRSFNDGATRELRLSRPDLEALVPVIQKRMKLIVSVRRASDILEVIKLARDYSLDVVVAGGEEAWVVAKELAAARIPVMLNPTNNLPGSFEMRDATMENAARLARAGVLICFANGDGGHRAREARYNAGNAVAHGLSHARAVEALTVNAARIFGEAGSVGSIERGKTADLVVWSGDPLEPLSEATSIIIAGKMQPMTSRADELAKRYRKLDETLPPAYRH
jgi:imidazolonepropionase-like amidohydrolase